MAHRHHTYADTCDPITTACLGVWSGARCKLGRRRFGMCLRPAYHRLHQHPSQWSPAFIPPLNNTFRSVGEFGWAYSILNAANNRNTSGSP